MRKLFSTLALLLALGLMLALLLPRPAVAAEDDAPALISHDDMVVVALSLIGSPYKYGGASPDTGFDCSGLVKYILGLSSPIVLPRSSAEMYADSFGRKIALSELKAGDLLFFRIGKSKRVNHVAVFIGENRFVHAPATGGFVRVDQLGDKYWTRYFLGAKRVLPENDLDSPADSSATASQ
ncbi:MAG TPA: C40 family peptidase [Moraxellaceae bacterium]